MYIEAKALVNGGVYREVILSDGTAVSNNTVRYYDILLTQADFKQSMK